MSESRDGESRTDWGYDPMPTSSYQCSHTKPTSTRQKKEQKPVKDIGELRKQVMSELYGELYDEIKDGVRTAVLDQKSQIIKEVAGEITGQIKEQLIRDFIQDGGNKGNDR